MIETNTVVDSACVVVVPEPSGGLPYNVEHLQDMVTLLRISLLMLCCHINLANFTGKPKDGHKKVVEYVLHTR